MERGAAGEWRGLTYAEVLAKCVVLLRSCSQELSVERPVVILSEKWRRARSAYAGVSSRWGSRRSRLTGVFFGVQDFARLKKIIGMLQPGLVFRGQSAPLFKRPLRHQSLHSALVVFGEHTGRHLRPDFVGSMGFEALRATTPDTAAVARALAAVTPQTIAKFMFTSGSTDRPKAVISTHRMLCSNQQAIAQSMAVHRSRSRAREVVAMAPQVLAAITASTWSCATAAPCTSMRGCPLRDELDKTKVEVVMPNVVPASRSTARERNVFGHTVRSPQFRRNIRCVLMTALGCQAGVEHELRDRLRRDLSGRALWCVHQATTKAGVRSVGAESGAGGADPAIDLLRSGRPCVVQARRTWRALRARHGPPEGQLPESLGGGIEQRTGAALRAWRRLASMRLAGGAGPRGMPGRRSAVSTALGVPCSTGGHRTWRSDIFRSLINLW